MKKIFFLILISMPGLVKAQTHSVDFKPTYGVATTITPNQFEFSVPFWLSKKTILSPFLAIQMDRPHQIKGSFIGLELKQYLKQPNTSVPYLILDAGYTDKYSQGFAGIGFGGDYFISSQLSIGAELKSRYTFRDVGTRLGTGVDRILIIPGISFGVHF